MRRSSPPRDASGGDGAEAVVLTGGPIRTMDAATASPEAVVVVGDRIAAVGARDEARRWAGASVVDLAGRTLVPGFIDAHNHLSIAALVPAFGDASHVVDRDGLVDAIRAQDAAAPDAEWVRLHGWNDAPSGYVPTRDDLDAAGVDRPVVLAHFSLHQCVASSAALEALGVGRSTPDPAGGEIVRRADGEPAGLLVERAWSEAHARSLTGYADPDRWSEHVESRARELLRDGITAVHDAACDPDAESMYARMVAAGRLPISVLAMPHPRAILRNDLGARLDGPPTGEGDERLRVGAAKLFADGGVAIALDTSVHGHPVRFGMLMDDLERCALVAADRGFRVAVHAIGNVGVESTIRAFSAVRAASGGDVEHRFRLEHAGVTSPDQWRRLADLEAVAVVQPGFVEHVGIQSGGVRFDDHHWLAFAGLAEAGVRLAGSSDDPCAPASPVWGALLGASRTTSTGIAFEPDQAIDFDDWLFAYTAGAAHAGGQEHERGRLAVGLRADLVMLDTDASPPVVSETWVGGRCVYSAPGRAGKPV